MHELDSFLIINNIKNKSMLNNQIVFFKDVLLPVVQNKINCGLPLFTKERNYFLNPTVQKHLQFLIWKTSVSLLISNPYQPSVLKKFLLLPHLRSVRVHIIVLINANESLIHVFRYISNALLMCANYGLT